VLGGIMGYAIGYWLWDVLADPIMRAYGYADAKLRFDAWYGDWGLWIILIKGLTPIPYKIITIASGATKFPLLVFVAASVLTRGARFFLLALLLRRYGEPIRGFIEKRLTLVTSVAAAGVVGGFLLLKLL
jgi:membrane protein YqaA with SNARE-associated domain